MPQISKGRLEHLEERSQELTRVLSENERLQALDTEGLAHIQEENRVRSVAIEGQKKEIERLTAEVDEYQQYQDEIIVALGSKGLLPSEIVKEIERLTAEVSRYHEALNYIQFRGSPEIMAIAIEALRPIAAVKTTEQGEK